MISLYYVRNLSRLDTPEFFVNGVFHQEYQDAFFHAHLVRDIDTGFYPPHFHNVIAFSVEEFGIGENINYLSISSTVNGGKTYYYFIDKIEYASETTINVYITMDVIQTYMGQILIDHARLTKSTIKRKVNGNINREYMRENLSNGIYQVDTMQPKLSSEIWFLVIKMVEQNSVRCLYYETGGQADLQQPLHSAYVVRDNKRITPTGYIYALIPFVNDTNADVHFRQDNSEYNYGVFSNKSMKALCHDIRKIQEMPCVVDMYMLPITLINQLHMTMSVSAYSYTFKAERWGDPDAPEQSRNYVSRLCKLGYLDENNNLVVMPNLVYYVESLEMIKYESSITVPFVDNNTPGQPFDWHHIPQLLDENYIRVEYGERAGTTGYPLHVMTDYYLRCTEYINPTSNERIYYLGNVTDNSGWVVDKYLTANKVTTNESLELFNDAYQTYLSQNLSTLTRGYKLAKDKNVYDTIKGAAKGALTAGMGAAIGMASPVPIAGDIMGFKGGTGFVESIADGFMNNYMIDEQRAIGIENQTFAPDTEKQGNSCSTDLLLDSLDTFVRISIVTDIEDCAKNFESFGYSVHEDIDYNPLTIHNRYYFDVVQATNLSIALYKAVSDEATIKTIRDRFASGLRLWHTSGKNILGVMGKPTLYDNPDV